MSFTAEVKDELSRVEAPDVTSELAQLSALIRVCGTLSFRGPERYSIKITTETGAVARTLIKLTHKIFDLETSLTVRRSVLHKTRNYLIEIPEQDALAEDLVRLGILATGRGLTTGVPASLVRSPQGLSAFVRGAFMAGGFIADPRGDFHLEIAVTREDFARGLAELIGSLGVSARLNRRRGAFAIYLKSFDDIIVLLRAMGARRMARVVEAARAQKSVKNDVNRRVNAEMANQVRSSGAALSQLDLIDRAERTLGLASLPPALASFCEARRAHPELSLVALGAELDPPASKSAIYHRVLRLQGLVEEAERAERSPGADL
ncbi:DNA-binding protein WhiA [Thermophilibacter immobilis]|uniref:Probable cell division protein WhiA n=1 Tax=Thermophilibacter immobilis TaxID=2779519 RepID=A0A7S7M9M4_9ACTN|nr:DNA-binding protein WhiA [Thermophilibacter immobilis]QOY61287.1 DNA-binding protein WhiA [Thermophilibacter immobilis]